MAKPKHFALPPLIATGTVPPTNPLVGDIYFDTEFNKNLVYDGAKWLHMEDPTAEFVVTALSDSEYTHPIIEFLTNRYPHYETFRELVSFVAADFVKVEMSESLTAQLKRGIRIDTVDTEVPSIILVTLSDIERDCTLQYVITEEKVEEYFKPTSLIFDQTRNIETPKPIFTAGIDLATSGSASTLTFINHSSSDVMFSLPSGDSFNIDERFKELTFMTKKHHEEVADKILNLENKINKKTLWKQSILNICTTLKARLTFGFSKKE